MKTGVLSAEEKYEQTIALLTDKIEMLETTVNQQSNTINEMKSLMKDKFEQILEATKNSKLTSNQRTNKYQKSNENNDHSNSWDINDTLIKTKFEENADRIKLASNVKLRSSFLKKGKKMGK